MVSPSQEQIRAQIDKLLPEYAPSGKFARGEQGSFKDFAKKQAEGMKKAGIGVAVGTAAIPSDLLELNKLVNDLAINYGSKNISAIATSVQPQIDFLQQKFGRAKFDKMLNSIGIPSDASDPAQMTGEIISGFISGKALVKGLQTGIKKSLPKEKVNVPKSKQVYKEPLKFPKSQLEVTRETLPAFKAADIKNLDATTKKVFSTVFTTRKPATDYFKDLFNTNTNEAREYLSELLYSKNFGGTKEFGMYDVVSENRLNKVKKNIYDLTQKKLEAYPWDECIADQTKRYGKEAAPKICGYIKEKYG